MTRLGDRSVNDFHVKIGKSLQSSSTRYLIPKISSQPASETQWWQCDPPKTDSCFGFRTTCKNKSINKQVKELKVEKKAFDLHRSVAKHKRENKSKV